MNKIKVTRLSSQEHQIIAYMRGCEMLGYCVVEAVNAAITKPKVAHPKMWAGKNILEKIKEAYPGR